MLRGGDPRPFAHVGASFEQMLRKPQVNKLTVCLRCSDAHPYIPISKVTARRPLRTDKASKPKPVDIALRFGRSLLACCPRRGARAAPPLLYRQVPFPSICLLGNLAHVPQLRKFPSQTRSSRLFTYALLNLEVRYVQATVLPSSY